ncbi:MAG: 4-alpha-glucanotransferase [Bacteroidales bacterium]
MKIHFSIPYNLSFGQRIFIMGSIPELSSFDTKNAKPLSYDGFMWSYNLILNNSESFEYSYLLIDDSGEPVFESGPARKFHVSSFEEYIIRDEWKSYSDESPFLSSAFKKVFYFRDDVSKEATGDVRIRLSANNTPLNGEIVMCGNHSLLGNWLPERGKRLHQNGEGLWETGLNSKELPAMLEYKFVLVTNRMDITAVAWEKGENRKLDIPQLKSGELLIINHFSINLEARKTRIAGTSVPVFSLRSKESCGMGDFMDLKKMIDFLYKTRQNVLQILPINDTTMTHTWTDSYPYGAISIYAIHPLYINTEAAGKINDPVFMKSFCKKAAKLNNLDCIDYDAVETLKWSYLEKLYDQDGKKRLSSKEYVDFFLKNRDWLVPYAAFCTLRDRYKTAEFRKWPRYSTYSETEIAKLTDESGHMFNKIAIHYFVQFILHKQLTFVHDYANSKRIILKGDIPIGVNRNSVEAWVEPHLFNFNGQAGAPPDDFSVKGQNWSFPTYDWTRMESDGYSWWKKRFRKMAEYFDAYRIDHILGFFRIWEIPADSTEGLMGHFNPALPFTAEEIRWSGYQFNYDRDCKPYIKEWVLDDYFGLDKEIIKNTFLHPADWESYQLKEEFDSQSKIEKYFLTNSHQEVIEHKNELLSLCSEVLFIQDPIDLAKYHPRISAQFSKSYQALDNWQKDMFDKVYNNYFYQRNDEFWYRNAMKKLPSLISATGMLACGEDLGMIPSCVPSVMRSLRILSLEIQRMPKDPKEKLGNPAQYPYLSVCTTGSHDTSTIRAWWKENNDTTCEPWLCEKILELHLLSPSMLSIFPIQDWFSISGRLRRENPDDERINVPSNPKHYWRYRIHINLEELVNDEEFIASVRKMIESTGRVLS